MPDPDILPSQRRLLVSFAWALGNALAGSAAYAVLLRSPGIDTGRVTVMSSFALSWVVGFLVFPLPGGIGVREAVLVAVVPSASSAALLGASLAHRMLVLASEVVATLGSQVIVARERRAQVARGAPRAAASAGGAAHPATVPADDARGRKAGTSPAEEGT
jgi:uncharacterized membrane protein YbhN (UPF0104 family)